MIMTKKEFLCFVNAFCDDTTVDNMYVVFKAAYTEKGLEKEKYSLELLEWEFEHCSHVWLNDWDEGQNYIDFFGMYTERDLLKLILTKDKPFKITDIEE